MIVSLSICSLHRTSFCRYSGVSISYWLPNICMNHHTYWREGCQGTAAVSRKRKVMVRFPAYGTNTSSTDSAMLRVRDSSRRVMNYATVILISQMGKHFWITLLVCDEFSNLSSFHKCASDEMILFMEVVLKVWLLAMEYFSSSDHSTSFHPRSLHSQNMWLWCVSKKRTYASAFWWLIDMWHVFAHTYKLTH